MNVIHHDTSAQKASAAKPPAHEVVYLQLRDLVLFGELAPGDAVTIQGLVQTLGAGMTPVREAIRRLIAEGALRFQGNRRVSVPALSLADLDEIDFLRKTVESQLTERAFSRISEADIDALIQIDAALDTAIMNGDVHGYLKANYQFHSALYSHADAPILFGVADQLWLRFGPSLRVVCGRFGTENLPDRHKELLSALKNGNAEAATRAIVEDVAQGTHQMRQVLKDAG